MTFSVGVDVGGTKILAGLVNETGAIVATARRESPRDVSHRAMMPIRPWL